MSYPFVSNAGMIAPIWSPLIEQKCQEGTEGKLCFVDIVERIIFCPTYWKENDMRSKQRRQQPPLKTAIRLCVCGALLLIAAAVIPLTSVNCTYDGPVQLCFVSTYYGLDAHTFGIVLGILSVLFFAGGVFYLNRHKQTLAAPRSGVVFSAPQPFAPQQPGVYPPVQQPGAYPPAQNAIFPGSYTGDASSQPPSNTFPRQ
jgi:hypothetical protein